MCVDTDICREGGRRRARAEEAGKANKTRGFRRVAGVPAMLRVNEENCRKRAETATEPFKR